MLHFVKVHQDLRSQYNFRMVHFRMLKKAFAYVEKCLKGEFDRNSLHVGEMKMKRGDVQISFYES